MAAPIFCFISIRTGVGRLFAVFNRIAENPKDFLHFVYLFLQAFNKRKDLKK